MGQAKLRGSKEERIKQASERIAALRPDKLTCNNCKTDFTEFEMLDTRGLSGIEMACVGTCPECSEITWGLKGDPVLCQAFAEHIMRDKELAGDQLKLGVQKMKND